MGYIEDISWLPKNFNYYQDFAHTFGFHEYYEHSGRSFEYVSVHFDPVSPIAISGYDTFLYVNLYGGHQQQDETTIPFEKNSQKYSLTKKTADQSFILTVKNERDEEIISYSTKEIIDHFYQFDSNHHQLTSEEATFITENNRAEMKLVVQNLNFDKSTDSANVMMDVYVFIKLK